MSLQNTPRGEYRVWRLWTKYEDLWKPPPNITVSEWADQERRLSQESSAEPGRWVTAKAEYQRGIMDAISDLKQEQVVVMSAAQVGKSEIINNTIGMHIDISPCPMMMVQPTIDDGEEYSKDRLAPMFRDTPVLADKIFTAKSRTTGNTLRHKKFPGGQLFIGGANSPSGLASKPIRLLLLDEVDRYPQSAGTEGDPVQLAMKRTQNFWNRKIVMVSTPTIKGISRIEKAFADSTQEEWCVPCPKCGKITPFEWGNFFADDPAHVLYKCQCCGEASDEQEWHAGQSLGKWVPANPGARVRGFHVTAFSSPWTTWEKLVLEYQKAKRDGEEHIKVWWNTALGLPYEEQGAALDSEALETHREDYGAEVPDGALVLTCGVDTQDNRLEAEVVGWGPGKESWGICYRAFYGDPGQREVWDALDEFLAHLWTYRDGEQIGIGCTCIDSGGHFTDEVYRFVKSRERRNIFAIKGSSMAGKPGISPPTRRNRRRVALFSLGVSALKGSLFSRLQVELPGPGYCHWPKDLGSNHRGYDGTYFKGLVSERMVIKKLRGRVSVEWVKRSSGARNEPLDTRVYATAALEILNPDLERRRERRTVKKKTAGKRRPGVPMTPKPMEIAEPPLEPAAPEPEAAKKSSGKKRPAKGKARMLSGGIS